MSATTFSPDLSLSPSQEGLLRTALTSNTGNGNSSPRPTNGVPGDTVSYKDYQQPYTGTMANGSAMYKSPNQKTPGSGQLSTFDESPFLNYETLEDGNFDWDNSGDQLFGDLPDTEYNEFNEFNDENEHHDKRKASSDQENEEEGSSKRRESDDKAEKKPAQKPGRKPLTGEPTTKRKAQNRAAQRAFRERKERHLKDLETKVEDLEKASEATNHENGRLRATVDKLQVELKEYRKRISLNATSGYSPPQSATQPRGYNTNDNDISFAFPKFGDLPGSYLDNGSIVKTASPPQNGKRSTSSSSPSVPGVLRKDSSNSNKVASPTTFNTAASSYNNTKPNQTSMNSFASNDYGDLGGLFSPSVLEYASRSNSTDYLSYPGSNTTSNVGTAKQYSIGSTSVQSQVPNFRQSSSTSINGSPSSSVSHALDSSCGTTPESSADSPDNRKGSESVLNTINEEDKAPSKTQATPNIVKSPIADISGFDWMAQQNGGQFDPVLFGDYRDPQDNIINNSYGDFFNEAFPQFNDFTSPYNMGDFANQPTKKDFMKEIEVRQIGSPKQGTPANEEKRFLTCDKLWDRVQSSRKAQCGETDMDDLCSQLKSKAKCSGKGAVIDQKDVDEILGPAPTADFMKI